MLQLFSLTPLDAVAIPIGTLMMFLFIVLFEKSSIKQFVKLAELRDEKTDGAKEITDKLEADALKIEKEVNTKIAEVRVAALKEKTDYLAKIRKQASGIVEQAENEAQGFIKLAREQTQNEVKDFENKFKNHAASLTAEIAGKFLSIALVVLTSSLIVFSSAVLNIAYANDEGAHHGPALSTYWISFTLYLIMMFVLCKKPIKAAWAKRRHLIADTIANNARTLNLAKERLAKAQNSKVDLNNSLDNIKVLIGRDAENESENILREARETAERITRQSHETTMNEKKGALSKAKEELINKLVKEADSMIKSKINEGSDRRLRDRSVADFSKIN